MAITNRTLAPGTQLTVTYKKQTYTAEVVETPEGLRYRLADGREFKSPSAAGAAIMGAGRTCNGWAFWSVEGGEPTSAGEAPTEPAQPKRGRRKAGAEASEVNGETKPIIAQLDETFECGECGTTFATREDVEAHLAEVHPSA